MAKTIDTEPAELVERLEDVLVAPVRLTAISSNYGITIHRAETASGRFAVKSGRAELADHLAVEAAMLADLRADGALIVPATFYSEDDLLITEWIETDGTPIGAAHERAAAEALAKLHATPRGAFGYRYTTTIGGLAQPNPETPDWLPFFRDARLMHFARAALAAGEIDPALMARIEALAARVEDFLAEPAHAALIHGDAWFGNVLTRGNRIAAWIDPALAHAHPEIELAYVTMHGTFGAVFFDTYNELSPIEPGFFDSRRDLYNIVPNLVHVRLCGPTYIAPIDDALSRVGL